MDFSLQPFIPYLKWIESQTDYLKHWVKTWSEINSYSYHTEGLKTLTDIIKRDFTCLEGKVEVISLSLKEEHPIKNKANQLYLGEALRIRKRPSAPIQILLAGHLDTVYSPLNPFQKVIEKDHQTWIGPGVTDMKGGIAILLTTLMALERSPYAEQIGWEVIINPDEEIGSIGSRYLFKEASQRNLLGMIFEPSFSDGAFVSARKGSSTFNVTVKGKAAHVGRDFPSGRHAIYALSQFINHVEALNQMNRLIVNVGFIEGGGPVNIVPDHAFCRLNVRSSDPIEIMTMQSQLDEIAHLHQIEGISFTIINETERLPKPFDKNLEAIFDLYGDCARQLHIPFQLRETGGVCDGNITSEAGLPTMDSLGAVGGNIHTPEEYLFLPSLIERSKLASLFLFRLATSDLTIQEKNNDESR
jgi:glutamate carboxypeptidase